MRAVYLNNNLYFSFRLRVAPGTVATENKLYLGFRQVTGGDLIIVVTLNNLAPSAASNNRVTNVFVRNSVDGTGAPQTVPGWLDDTKVWVNNPTPNSFTVNLRVPMASTGLSVGVNVGPAGGSTFPMWYELISGPPGGATTIAIAWPPSSLVTEGFSGDIYPDPSAWRQFRLSTGAGDAACTGDVSLAYTDIGTLNTPSSQINLNSANTFFARPLNLRPVGPGNDITAGQIHARFRIANWGSQPNWEQVTDPNTLWQTIPGGGDVTHAAAISPGTKGNLTFPWTLSAAEKAPFLLPSSDPNSRRLHQCMLVQLSGGGLRYVNDSVYRNMDFKNASRIFEPAEISVVGLAAPDPTRPRHDVYLYVEKVHMPSDLKPGTSSSTVNTNLAKEFGRLSFDRMNVLIQQGGISTEQLEQFMPAYRVHVFHDTGRKMRLNGTRRAILVPQSSFGYYVKHDGELYGWDTHLYGAEKIAENFYKLVLHTNSTATIQTKINALEKPRGKGCCLTVSSGGTVAAAAGLGLLGLVVHLPWKRRSRSRRCAPPWLLGR